MWGAGSQPWPSSTLLFSMISFFVSWFMGLHSAFVVVEGWVDRQYEGLILSHSMMGNDNHPLLELDLHHAHSYQNKWERLVITHHCSKIYANMTIWNKTQQSTHHSCAGICQGVQLMFGIISGFSRVHDSRNQFAQSEYLALRSYCIINEIRKQNLIILMNNFVGIFKVTFFNISNFLV